MVENGRNKKRAGGKDALRVSRRDFIKYSAMAGAVASVLPLQLTASHLAYGTLPAEAGAGSASQDQFLENGAGKFRVDIPGLPMASANIQSVQVEDLTIEVRETTTGVDREWRQYAPGDAHYGNATFRVRVGEDGATTKELLLWLQDASVGKNIRKSITVIIYNKKGEEARRWSLSECFPVKFDPGDYSPSSTVACETLVVKIGRVELA